MSADKKILDYISHHSQMAQFHRNLSKASKAIEQFGLVGFHDKMADLHQETSDLLYQIRLFIYNDLLVDPAIENDVGKEIRRLLMERKLINRL